MKFTIGDTVYNTKSEAEKHIQSILYKYKPNQSLDFEDKQLIEHLIFNHPNAEDKIGPGIKEIQVQVNPVHRNTMNFVIVRVNGTETDFSFKKCLKKPTQKSYFLQASRRAVQPDIHAFKQAFFAMNKGPTLCSVLGAPLTRENAHVDHIPPATFENIILSFIKEHRIDINTIEFVPPMDNEYGREFLDKEFEQKWVDYHNEKAQLRVISARANLSNVKVQANQMKQNNKSS